MSPERLLALAGLVTALLLLTRLGPPAVRSWRIYAGTRSRRMADAGPLEIPAPPAVAARLEELRSLGFSRIGERYIRLPNTPVRYDWVMGEPSGETYALGVVSVIGGFLVALYSSFDDSTWVMTTFPRGETIDRRSTPRSSTPVSRTRSRPTGRRSPGLRCSTAGRGAC